MRRGALKAVNFCPEYLQYCAIKNFIFGMKAPYLVDQLSLNVRVGGAFREFVSSRLSEDGEFDNASEYVRHLIRQDKAYSEQKAFMAKRSALQNAFAEPDEAYVALSLQECRAKPSRD